MNKPFIATVLSVAISLAGTSLWAQSGGSGSGSSSGPQGTGSGSGIGSGSGSGSTIGGSGAGSGMSGGGASGSGRTGTSGTSGMTGASGSGMSGTAATAQQRQQIEGQLVDLFDISQQPSLLSSSGTIAEPGLRIERGDTSAPPISGTAGAASGNIAAGAGGPSPTPAANPNSSITPHVGDSAGTYNRPGAVGGSSDTSAAISGTSRLDPGDRTNPGMTGGAASGAQANTSFRMPAPDAVRAQLNAGIPAAIVANGQAYVLVCDPKQLSQFAGQTLRINGTLAGRNIIVPDRVEVRQAAGTFQPVNLTKPTDIATPRTVQER